MQKGRSDSDRYIFEKEVLTLNWALDKILTQMNVLVWVVVGRKQKRWAQGNTAKVIFPLDLLLPENRRYRLRCAWCGGKVVKQFHGPKQT